MKKFSELEEVGKTDELKWSHEDKKVHFEFTETITHESDIKNQVKLPVKENIEILSSNKSGAISRYNSPMAILKKDPERGPTYRETKFKFAEKGQKTKSQTVVYLPHHPVIKADNLEDYNQYPC